MSTIALWLSKAWLIVSMAVGGIAPVGGQALNPAAPATPAAPSYPRLQQAWAREQRIYDRMTRFYDNIDARIQRGQQLIDKAQANGKDVTALQAGLNTFEAAVKQAQPTYESIKGLVASHQGFDAAGNVVDPVKAFQTVLDMRDKLKEVRQIIVPPAKALRQAVRDFRAANQPVATPTP